MVSLHTLCVAFPMVYRLCQSLTLITIGLCTATATRLHFPPMRQEKIGKINYIPLKAVQSFQTVDSDSKAVENGVY